MAGETNNVQYISVASLPTVGNSDTNINFAKSKTILEASSSADNSKYTTRSITLEYLVRVLYDAGFSTLLSEKYGLRESDKVKISETYPYVKKLSDFLNVDTKNFRTTVKMNNSDIVNQDDLKDTLKNKNNYVSITNDDQFYTKYINLENNTAELEITNINGAPSTNDDKHNRYIFKVSQHTSESYICPRSGWFTCYGWLSEKETYRPAGAGDNGQGRQDNSKRWAALEGKIGDNWRILQLQPVAAGNYCNYVSFSLPVRVNLELRITTGFDVNDNSGKYSNVAGSLTNHIPNAFIGGIYAKYD